MHRILEKDLRSSIPKGVSEEEELLSKPRNEVPRTIILLRKRRAVVKARTHS